MIDIVTVVFEQELPVLQAQAQSIDLYCRNIGVKNIFVVVNDRNDVADQIDPTWWGSFADCVKVILRSEFGCSFVDNGWVSQQALKMLAGNLSTNTYSMVLDAKTIFVRPFPVNELFDNNKLCVGLLPIYPVFERSRQITNELFGIDLQYQAGPGGVPFFFQTSKLRAMIAFIENKTQQNFAEWFQAQGMLTEFVLYSGWLQRQGGLETYYSKKINFNVCNLCHSEVGIADNKLEFMKTPAVLTVSIHRNAWTQLSADQQLTYTKFLKSRNINKDVV